MLMIENLDYYNEVVKEAKKLGMYENEELQRPLKWCLDYLAKYADHEGDGLTRCWLYKDFAPRSFAFVMERKDKEGTYQRWFNGGLIFHGELDSGVGAPTFSVRLGDTSKSGWSIHT